VLAWAKRMTSASATTPPVALIAALLAAAPMLVTATELIIRRPVLYLDGDGAIDELALMRAGHLAQLVGNYSRFGWSEPGPAWFYALSAVYQPLGRESWAFFVASLVLQAAAAAMIVWTTWRIGGQALALIASGVLLVYYGLLGDQVFQITWPPFELMLPMALLLLLAGLAATGSRPALAGSLVVGSYLVQTHLGTSGAVGAVVGVAVAYQVIDAIRQARAREQTPAQRKNSWLLTGGGLALVVVMWIPPLINEINGQPRNLNLLWRFFIANGTERGWRAAFSAVGRYVDVFDFGGLSHYMQDVAVIDGGYIAATVVFGVLCAALAAAGTLARDRFAQATGILLIAATAAVAYSVRHVVGTVYDYLLLWVTTLPLVLVLGWAELAVHQRALLLPRVRPAARTAIAAAAWVAVIALAAARMAEFVALPPLEPTVEQLSYFATATQSALPADRSQPVLLDVTSLDTWVLAAGVGLQLEKHGYTIRVNPQWTFMFGGAARRQGNERWDVVFETAADASGFAAANPSARVIASTDTYTLFLVQLAPPP